MSHPEETAQDIFRLYNADPDREAVIELPAEDLHALALDWGKMRQLLSNIHEQLVASESTARELQREISKVLTVRDFLGRIITRADFDAESKAYKIEQNYR